MQEVAGWLVGWLVGLGRKVALVGNHRLRWEPRRGEEWGTPELGKGRRAGLDGIDSYGREAIGYE